MYVTFTNIIINSAGTSGGISNSLGTNINNLQFGIILLVFGLFFFNFLRIIGLLTRTDRSYFKTKKWHIFKIVGVALVLIGLMGIIDYIRFGY